MTCRRCFARWALRLRPPRCSRMRGYPPPPIARAGSDCLPAGCLRRAPVGLQGTVRWRRARRPVPRGTSWHGTCARVPRERALLPRRGSGPALVPPRILEVASTSTYASLVHSSLRSNRKEGAARRPVGKLTRSQGDGHGLCLRRVGECRHLPGPLGPAVPASWWGSEGSLWGVQWGLGASVPQARWGCCYRGDKAFRPGNMAKPDREREPDRRTGLQGPHSSSAPSSDTAQHSTGRSPSLPRPPHRGPSHLWGLQARRVAGPSREASAATRPRAQLTG